MQTLLHPLRIGPLLLENNLALAPMSGTSDRSFRSICREFGASFAVTELVSARGICHDPTFRRNWRYLAIDPAEIPVGIQLFGADPPDFERAIHLILGHPDLSACSMIDINMGCPVPKVVKSGAGAALMLDLERAARIIKASVRAAGAFGKPVTVKFRKGWDDGSSNAVPFARMCEESGASALTVHGRTRAQIYSGRADWAIIGAVKGSAGIPVYGNGDVFSAKTAAEMIRSTGVDGVMIGRAAQGRPWVFKEIAAGLADLDAGCPQPRNPAEPSPEEKVSAARRHLDGLIDLLGESTGVREMRGQMAKYMKGAPRGSELKSKAMKAQTRTDILAVLEDWHRGCLKSCENS